jgi:hypothetical protein
MFQLKRLSPEAIPAALKKAERYRLLNEPRASESICLDILEVDPANQEALIMLILARTDQFAKNSDVPLEQARELVPRLAGEYERAYYTGIIYERWAKARLTRKDPGFGPHVYHWLREAMDHYEQAERLREPGNDDALLRWNACARLIARHPQLRPAEEREDLEHFLE